MAKFYSVKIVKAMDFLEPKESSQSKNGPVIRQERWGLHKSF